MVKFFRKMMSMAVTLAALFQSQTVVAHAQVIINELFPNPNTGENEWVELWNAGEGAVDISGWQLWDQLSSPSLAHTFPASTSLAAGEFLVVTLNNVLNNSGDGLVLKNSVGDTMDAMSYTSSTKGKSWARDPDDTTVIFETDPTRAAANPTNTPSPTPTPTLIPSSSVSPKPTPSSAVNTKTQTPTDGQSDTPPSALNSSTGSPAFLYPPSVLKPKLSVEGPIFSDSANIDFSERPGLERGAVSVIMGSLFLLVPGLIYVKNRHPFS